MALVDAAAVNPARAEVEAVLAEPDIDPNDLAALDVAWEDTPVMFGPEAAGNCKDDLAARIRAARRPAVRSQ